MVWACWRRCWSTLPAAPSPRASSPAPTFASCWIRPICPGNVMAEVKLRRKGWRRRRRKRKGSMAGIGRQAPVHFYQIIITGGQNVARSAKSLFKWADIQCVQGPFRLPASSLRGVFKVVAGLPAQMLQCCKCCNVPGTHSFRSTPQRSCRMWPAVHRAAAMGLRTKPGCSCTVWWKAVSRPALA